MMVIASRWFTQNPRGQGRSHYFCRGDLSKEFIILITRMLKCLIYILSELDTFSQKYFNILCVGTLSIKYFYYDTQNFVEQLAQKFQHPSSFPFDKQRQGKVLSIYFMLCLMTQSLFFFGQKKRPKMKQLIIIVAIIHATDLEWWVSKQHRALFSRLQWLRNVAYFCPLEKSTKNRFSGEMSQCRSASKKKTLCEHNL